MRSRTTPCWAPTGPPTLSRFTNEETGSQEKVLSISLVGSVSLITDRPRLSFLPSDYPTLGPGPITSAWTIAVDFPLALLQLLPALT